VGKSLGSRKVGQPPARRPRARMGTTRFLDAARRWEIEVVTAALRAQPELAEATDRSGRSALHLCAAAKTAQTRRPVAASVATARVLIAAGTDIDAVHEIPDGGERFPARALWHAIARGRNRTLARYLLRQGANPNYCLWAVVWDDDVITARLLLSYGADLDLTFHGETPLFYATRLRRTRMLRWLLRHGADANRGDREGQTPLAYAVRRRYSLAEIEELLKFGADAHAAAADGATAMSLAASGRDPRLATLLRRYADGGAASANGA
jgi:ankyrin repeat protein